MPTSATDLVGTTLAERFDVLAFAAAGGMGYVYRARDKHDGATVALKVLPPESDLGQRFARESAALAQVDHPNVVRHVAHGTTREGAPYLAMEWLDGEDLSMRLDLDGVVGVDDAIALARQTAEGLGAVHRAGIVHRDLKPANLFLVEKSFAKVKLLDFGVARVGPSDLTVPGTVVGTPAYMAPEQVREDAVTPATDVYGLGALLFRALSGRVPFDGDHHLAILAKVILEPPPSLRELRKDIPPALAAFVARLLAKDPKDRPRDAVAVLAELPAARTSAPRSEPRVKATIGVREKRVACIVLCAGGTPLDATVEDARVAQADAAARRAVEQHGGSIVALAKGAWLVTIKNAASPRDEAIRAVKCALALEAARPAAPVCVATGRVLVTGEGRVGEVIDRATGALVATGAAAAGGVRIDPTTAELVEGHFRIEDSGPWRRVVGEEKSVAPVRTLLGKPAPCVGREAQLAMLQAALGACIDESRVGAALVVAPVGLGKTRLVRELLRASAESRPELDVLYAHGDPLRASSPFGLAAQIVSHAAEIHDADAERDRATKIAALVERDFGTGEGTLRYRELLGEICGVTPLVAPSPALRAARADLSVMADALRDAFTDWLAARAARAPALVVLEDVHWADASSLRLVASAATKLSDRRLFVLASARPEGSAAFTAAFQAGDLVELTLARLSGAAAERLVRGALGKEVAPELVATLVKRAGGHPFHLEELVRAVADGRGADALPDSVLATVQARFDNVSADARRLLRAASVFGETFRSAGVAALMGDEMSEYDIRVKLGSLVDRELLTAGRGPDDPYSFRHVLFRDVAYATLTDADCVDAHRRAATWLEEVGESDPAVLGEHYARGAAPEHAARHFHRAAAQALSRNDFDRAKDHARRALDLAPDASTEAALRAIEAEILYWRGDIATAAERAPSALLRLDRGDSAWFDAISVAVGALGQLGRNDEVATMLREAARVEAPSATRDTQVVALCRGMTQLFWAHAGAGLGDVRERLDALVAGEASALDGYPSGWVHRVRGESAWLHERDVGKCLSELDASIAAFDAARALRPLCLSRLNAASLVGWSGDAKRGLELVFAARADAEKLGAGFLVSYSVAVEGLLLAYSGSPDADATMRRALAAVAGNPRLAFICRIVLASGAFERGDLAAAELEVRAGESLRVADDLRAAGLALSSRLATLQGRHDEALSLAEQAVATAAACADLELTHGMSGLALAEAHAAKGARDAARAALAPTTSAIAAIAATIPSEEQRARYRERPIANDRISRLARELA